MCSHPKVSVVIPVYKVEQFIERCSRNLFEQTLNEIEYIFVDDCTPDKSIEILEHVLKEYPKRYSQVIIHHMDQNSGQAKVREWGMRHAKGEYVIHCDTDDWPEKDQYEKMYNIALENNSDLVFCDYYKVFEDGKKEYTKRDFLYEKKENILIHMLSGYHGLNQLWGCMMKHSLIEDIVYPSGNQGEDKVIMIQAITKSKRISYIQVALYNYLVNPLSIVHTIRPDKLIERALQSSSNLMTIINQLGKLNLLCGIREQIVFSKFEVRLILSAGLYDKRCRETWYQLFPEINGDVIYNKYISISGKMKELIMRSHCGALLGFFYKVKYRHRLN